MTFVHDSENHSLQVAEDLPRGNPHRREAEFLQILIAPRISLRPPGPVMCVTVHLDGQPRFQAGEIDGKRTLRAPSTSLRLVPLPVPGRIYAPEPHRHIRNTPNFARSGIGAFKVAAKARPSTSRVCAGSIIPSSHSRAVA